MLRRGKRNWFGRLLGCVSARVQTLQQVHSWLGDGVVEATRRQVRGVVGAAAATHRALCTATVLKGSKVADPDSFYSDPDPEKSQSGSGYKYLNSSKEDEKKRYHIQTPLLKSFTNIFF